MKRPIALLLSLVLLLSLAPTALAASDTPFTDVEAGAYYYDAVIWAREAGVTSGTSATTFSPGALCTRSQVVTFLWNAAGKPAPTGETNPFSDVSSTDWFYHAVLWAVESGITTGTSATTFTPGKTCTSAEVITFLHRASGKPAPSGDSPLAAEYGSSWFFDAVAWADSHGLLTGVGAAFDPNNASPRSDIVTYLYRNAGSPAVTQPTSTPQPTAPADAFLRVNGDSVVFSALPEDAAQMEAALQSWRSSEKAVAALFIQALAVYASDPDTAFSMMDALVGGNGLSYYDEQLLSSRMDGKESYLPFSYFVGAVQSNDYTPNEPYTVTVKEQSNSRDEIGYIKLFIPSGGADTARPIQLRQENGGWYVHEYSSLLLDIRRPAEKPEEPRTPGSASFAFTTLPQTAADMQAMSELDFTDPYAVAAFTIVALAAFANDREATYAMLEVLNGPTDLNSADKSTLSRSLGYGYDYLIRSYFRGATPENGYTPSTPYALDLTENQSIRKEDGYIRIDAVSSGSTSVRNIQLRLAKDGNWYLWNYHDLLRSISLPAEEDPWAT